MKQKNCFLSVLAMLVALVGHAQQALLGSAEIVSPEINSDHTVIFRIQASEALSVQVTLSQFVSLLFQKSNELSLVDGLDK